MKKFVLIFLSFLVLILFTGCDASQSSEEINILNSNQFKHEDFNSSRSLFDCKDNHSCLVDSAMFCQEAKANLEISSIENGYEKNSSIYFNLTRTNYNNENTCNLKLSFHLEDIEINKINKTSKEIDMEDIESKENTYLSNLKSQTNYCLGSSGNIYLLLTRWEEGNYDKDLMKDLGCSGPFFDWYLNGENN